MQKPHRAIALVHLCTKAIKALIIY